MKLLEINAVTTGSTGSIMNNLARVAAERGIDARCSFGLRRQDKIDKTSKNIAINGWMHHKFNCLLGRLFGLNDLLSFHSTKSFIKKIKAFNPDVIHLHIAHGNYLNIKMLFRFFSKYKKPIVWTMHDCWAVTGRCPHFLSLRCNKWKSDCSSCKYPKKDYPASFINNSKSMLKLKRELFSSLDNFTIVTPSEWLKKVLQESFLAKNEITVINNGIDLSIFNPVKSSFREENGIVDKKIVLAVASFWNCKKGLYEIIKLSSLLDDSYQIVIVGTSDEVDKILPSGILSIHRTNSPRELAKIYSESDLFINPTHEDTFPTVNIEALACGIPVLTSSNGGAPEIIDNSCGLVADFLDMPSVVHKIKYIIDNKNLFSKENCLKRASFFDKNNCFDKYIKLFYRKASKE